MDIEANTINNNDSDFDLLKEFGWKLEFDLLDDNCKFMERLLQSILKFLIRFFDIHRTDLSAELAKKSLIPKIIELIGMLIINPCNISKRKETFRTVLCSHLSMNGNESNMSLFKKELLKAIIRNIKAFSEIAKEYPQKNLEKLVDYMLMFDEKDSSNSGVIEFSTREDLEMMDLYSSIIVYSDIMKYLLASKRSHYFSSNDNFFNKGELMEILGEYIHIHNL